MKEVSLRTPYSNSPDSACTTFELAVDALRALQEAGGSVYLKFVDGDRKGSIARFISTKPVGYSKRRCTGFRAEGYNYSLTDAAGHCVWDGRKNKIQWSLHSPHAVWLPEYYGPTVWEKFDAKAAKAALLVSPNEVDIDGKPLAAGDSVLYINSRYGSGSGLCHGTVIRFEAKVDSKRQHVYTIVQMDGSDMESKIEHSGAYIWKK